MKDCSKTAIKHLKLQQMHNCKKLQKIAKNCKNHKHAKFSQNAVKSRNILEMQEFPKQLKTHLKLLKSHKRKKNPKFQKPPKNCKILKLQNTLKPKIAKNSQNFAISQKHTKIPRHKFF